MRIYEIPRRIVIFACRRIIGDEETPAADIVMQDLSVREVVPAILAQVLSEEHSPEGVLSRIFKNYVLASPIRLSTTTKTPQSQLHRCCHGLMTLTQRRVLLKLLITGVGFLFPCILLFFQRTATNTSLIIGHNTVRSNDPVAGAWFPDVLDEEHMLTPQYFPLSTNSRQT